MHKRTKQIAQTQGECSGLRGTNSQTKHAASEGKCGKKLATTCTRDGHAEQIGEIKEKYSGVHKKQISRKNTHQMSVFKKILTRKITVDV